MKATTASIASIAVVATLVTTASAQPSPEPSEPEATPIESAGTPIPEVAAPEEVGAEQIIEREPDGTAIIEVRRLTPVLPQTTPEGPQNAYQLYWELDIPVLIAGASLAAARFFREGSGLGRAPCLFDVDETTGDVTARDQCDPDELNGFDRLTAGRYSPMWGTISDVAALTLIAAPIPVLWADEGFLPMLNDMVVVYQSALLAVAFSGMATLTSGRARPFVYGQEAPVETRTSGNGALSYISSHTSGAFALATSLFWTLERRRGMDGVTWAVFLIGEGTAALVATSRVLAGSHFPTDVLVGALVGMGMGTLVPTLHGSPVRVSASASDKHAQAGFEVAF